MPEILKNSVIFCILSVIIFSCVTEKEEKLEIKIVTYNVHNLFDDVDNGTEYPEFDPGSGKWSSEDFHEKLNKLTEVIKHVSDKGPDIIAFQEIENENVINILCNQYLSDYKYTVMYPVSDLAVNCAVVSRIKPERVGVLIPEESNLRAIIEVELNINGNELYIFNNHWKSKVGGEMGTEVDRLLTSELLAERISEILSKNPSADILVLGDFNEDTEEYFETGMNYQTALLPYSELENFDSRSLFLTENTSSAGLYDGKIVLYETWYETENSGSYVYKEKWQNPDHILLNSGLFDKTGFYYKQGDFQYVANDILLDSETGFPLKNTNGEYAYSDHLPLLISINY